MPMRTNTKPIPATPNALISQTPQRKRVDHFSFFLAGPLTFAVPRSVFCRFLRCLPVICCQYSIRRFKTLPCSECRDVRRTLLSAGLLNLRSKSNTDQSEMGLEFLQGLW